MRMARIKEPAAACYHMMSRIIEGQRLLDEGERERFRRTMRAVEGFCGVRVLTYAVLESHFHILLYVPQREEIDDEELLRRLGCLYAQPGVKAVGAALAALRAAGDHAGAARLRERYTRRMYDISEFGKTLKQRVSQSYNRRHNRKGTLWEDRFKSPLVEGCGPALPTVGGYIDLNAVRAGLAQDPKDYRCCGYGEAMGGGPEARRGIREIVCALGSAHRWPKASALYRQWLFEQGEQKGLDAEGRPTRAGFSPEKVQAVLDAGGRLSRQELLRCRVRYFSDGLALGRKAYVEDVFRRHRRHFSARRRSGARKMEGGDWGDLYTLRRLRVNVIRLPSSG